MPVEIDRSDIGKLEKTYDNLISLWTSGVRDYHSLLSDYLTANSIFVAAIGFILSRPTILPLFTGLVTILCTFVIMMAVQMAIVLGRFSVQNALWEWQLRGIEQRPGWAQKSLFVHLHRLRDAHETLHDPQNDVPDFQPTWAIRQHRQWWARREISFPLFFGMIYVLFLFWGISELFVA